MNTQYHKFKSVVKSFFTDSDITSYLLKSEMRELFPCEVNNNIKNSSEKTKIFFEEFEKLGNNLKYEKFINLTKNTSEWIKYFLDDSNEAKEIRRLFLLTLRLFQLQMEDLKENLYLDDVVLHRCCSVGLITELQLDELKAYLTNHGRVNTQAKFLLQVGSKSVDWYGKLLFIYYDTNTDFIKKYIPELNDALENCKSDKMKYITEYVRKVIKSNVIGVNEPSVDTILTSEYNSQKISLSDSNKFLFDLEEIPSDEYVNNIQLSDDILLQAQQMELISFDSCLQLINILRDKGLQTARIQFLLEINCKDSDWYGKLLQLYDLTKSDFIAKNLPHLHKEIVNSQSEEEKKNLILIYGMSIIETKNTGFKCKGDDQNSDKVSSDLLSNENSLTNCCVYSDINEGNKNWFRDLDNRIDDYDTDEEILREYNCPIKELLAFAPIKRNLSSETLEMREYQKELANKGISGFNVLIFAPTGCGKTIVAVKIVEEHFKNKNDGKVVFLVPTKALVDQCTSQFKKYLKSIRILSLSGNSASGNVSLIYQISDNDLFIMTSDIFKNALESEDFSSESIGMFSLIIFDECDHCDKGHSYNKVMNFYFINKESNLNVPQIVGMTASVGTDKASFTNDALDSLFNLCANLDCEIVSTVKYHLSELQRNQSIPFQDTILNDKREYDRFEEQLIKIMCEAEARIIALNNISGTQSNEISFPPDKSLDKYLNVISSFNDLPNCGPEIRSIAKYLGVLYRSLLINILFTSNDSLEFIKRTLQESPADYELFMHQKIQGFISTVTLDQGDNRNLQFLTNEITKQFEENKDSRVIIFVKQINYTKILADIINSMKIKNVRCSSFVGTNKSSGLGGSTSSAHSDILQNFRCGNINVLCCTSVADRGLDIPTCNLVIRYGHVINETSMIQTRGRARAKDSKYVVIVPCQMEWQVQKEKDNRSREKMMYEAIEKFQRMKKEEIIKEKIERQTLRQLQSMDLNDNIGNRDSGNWTIICKSCERYLCDSDDIRVINKNHHVVINKERFHNLPVGKQEKNNSPIHCKCGKPIGRVYKQRISLPSLTVKNIKFQQGDEKKNASNWTLAPFQIHEAKAPELIKAKNNVYTT